MPGRGCLGGGAWVRQGPLSPHFDFIGYVSLDDTDAGLCKGNFRVALSGPRTQQHKCGLSVPDSTQCWAGLPGGPAVLGIRRVAVVPRAGNGELGTQEARASRTAGEGRGHRCDGWGHGRWGPWAQRSAVSGHGGKTGGWQSTFLKCGHGGRAGFRGATG